MIFLGLILACFFSYFMNNVFSIRLYVLCGKKGVCGGKQLL